MTWPACGAEDPPAAAAPPAPAPEGPSDLEVRSGRDGSFSLWSATWGEGFHSGRGALREARETFLAPSQLERFLPGGRLTVVEVCVGTGSNLALLLERCHALGLELRWWGLELDPRPLRLALAAPAFRSPWSPRTLGILEQLAASGGWRGEGGEGRLLPGDARRRLPDLLHLCRGGVDLLWQDAFSPQRCPQLWSLEFLRDSAALLRPDGRWISYCSAAAVREALRLAALEVVALWPGQDPGRAEPGWSGGSVASPRPLPEAPLWRPLTRMEREHRASTAGEPYRDPSRSGEAALILAARRQAQAASLASGARASGSAWRRRWGVGASRAAPP